MAEQCMGNGGARRLLQPLLILLTLAGVVGIFAAVPHAVTVDVGMAEEALAKLLTQPHPGRPSNFEVFLATADTGSSGAQRKLQELKDMKHWTEVAYGVPYSKVSEKWVEPLGDPSKPYVFYADGEAPITRTEEQIRRGLMLEAESRRRLSRSSDRKSLGLSASPQQGPSMASMNGSYYRWDSIVAPSSVDWRTTEAITTVKSQGQCASCWALAAADSISMMWSIKGGAGRQRFQSEKKDAAGDPQYEDWGKLDVSAQEMCDCGLTGTCCDSGWPEVAFNYVMNNGGVSSWQDYPYFSMDSTCNADMKKTSMAQMTGWERVPASRPEAAQKAVAQQPFLAFISASSPSFQTYLGGYYDGECGEDLDHVVLVVGYGTSEKGPYWIIKNSWGTNWGEEGYMYLAAKPGKGKCGMHAAPGLFPTYYPATDPCGTFPNPCGAGTCYSVSMRDGLKQARCGCPSGFVENNQTNPAKCVKEDPCSDNPNPCGAGICSSLRDGSYACTCPHGFKSVSRTDGAPTCGPDNKQGGASTVTITEGTTIKDVLKAYGLKRKTLLELNPWLKSSDELPPGAVLAIGHPGATVGCSSKYVVQSKETCEDVASRYGIDDDQLEDDNPLVNCDKLLPGTELCLKKEAVTDDDDIPPLCGKVLEVEEDETCQSIRQRTNLSLDIFTKLNPGVNCNKPLEAGLVLCTEAAKSEPGVTCNKQYTVQHGDTCPSIALMANLTHTQFATLNAGFRCTVPYLQVGQVVCIDSAALPLQAPNLIPYIVQLGDTLLSISNDFVERCGQGASTASICEQNRLPSCANPAVGSLLKIPCKGKVGRSCGCAWDYSPRFGADGVWYQNYCDANCNYALPALTYSEFCKTSCKYRAGLAPINDPNQVCTNPCKWPQWNPQPQNWWWFASTFCGYYIGACQDWCSSSANTLASWRGTSAYWSTDYNNCVASCRSGKC